jgi:pyruvate dehydrogenase E2 component (dihydrolipoamide acetyltransferase)
MTTSDVQTVTMPKLGETVTEGTVGTWFKQVGDTVAFDDPLFEVSTDKVDSEIPSPYDGVVVEILVQSGDTVPVGSPVVRIGPPGSPVAAAPAPQAEAVATPPAAAQPATAQPAAAPPDGEVHEVTMPKLGETVTEGTVGTWFKQVGETVAFDDPLFEVSTDKVDSEIPSPYDGVLLEVFVQSGQTVPVGTAVARIGERGAASAPAAVPAAAPEAPAAPPAVQTPDGGRAAPAAEPGAEPGALLSPVVRRLAAEHGVDLTTVPGTGLSGRIRREDVERAIAAGGSRAPVAPAPPQPAAAQAAPAAPAPSAPATPSVRPTAPAAVSTDPRDQVEPLSRMRLAVAEGMVASLNTSAHVWTSVEVDFDAIDKVRARHKDRFRKETGASLSYLPFVSRATVDALRAFPAVNSSIDIPNKTRTLHPYVNLGIAVDLDEQGLVVPVVKDADALNIRGIASKIATMAAAARAKKLGMADMTGSTFTITNPGPFQSYASSPVINQPNVAILCTDGVQRRPVAVGDAISIHPVGIIGLVYDHRAFDGSTASKFLMHLRDSLQDRDWEAELS